MNDEQLAMLMAAIIYAGTKTYPPADPDVSKCLKMACASEAWALLKEVRLTTPPLCVES